jgi:hypothetical protein
LYKAIKNCAEKQLTFSSGCGMIITTKGNSKEKPARGFFDERFQAIGFPRSEGFPLVETILYQKGGRGPMAKEESRLHMLSASGIAGCTS